MTDKNGHDPRCHRTEVDHGRILRHVAFVAGIVPSACPSRKKPTGKSSHDPVAFRRCERRPVLGAGPRLRPRPDVLVSPGVRPGPVQRRGDHRPPAELPEHLLADEHHQTLDGQKVYIATTVGAGCVLGAEPAATAGTDDLKAAYGVFKDEARDIAPEYAPKTVSTDGWKGTKAAWKSCSRRSSSSSVSCTGGSRSGTGAST